MFGSGEELSNIEFAAGRASFDAAGSKKLESLAKALVERNALKLEITGWPTRKPIARASSVSLSSGR